MATDSSTAAPKDVYKRQLPGWMGADPSLHRDASIYFAIICAPMLFRSFSIIFASVLRAVGDTKTPMVVNGVMNLCNIVLNQLFISSGQTFHILGFPCLLYTSRCV